MSQENVKKVRKALNLEQKLNIIKMLEAGEKICNISKTLNLAASTIATIKANKEKISASVENVENVVAKRVTRQRGEVMESMEKLLSIWIDHQAQRNVPVSTAIIREKAISLHNDLQQRNSSEENETFVASKGWFDRFKKRYCLHNIKTTGEAASADFEAANSYPEEFNQIVTSGEYTAQQIYNVDETGLFWKRMPSRTFTTGSKQVGYKAAKDRVTVLFGANAAGDHKLKPMVIYHAENPRAMKGQNKTTLPVIWRANKKGWMTASLFDDWLNNHFTIAVTKFNQTHNLSNKALLVIDNAPSHVIMNIPENIKIIFLPPNTTPLLQPMDMGIIANVKAYYLRRVFKNLIKVVDDNENTTIQDYWKKYHILDAIKNISLSWNEVKGETLNKVWSKLWPDCTGEVLSECNNAELIDDVQNDIVAIANRAGIHVEAENVAEVLTASEDFSNEYLINILNEQGAYHYVLM